MSMVRSANRYDIINREFVMESIQLCIAAVLFLSGIGGAWAAGDWEVLNPANPPSARIGHSMMTLPDGKILLFGGEDEAVNMFSNLFAYENGQWTSIAPSNAPPSARRNQSSWIFDGKMYIHGGVGKDHRMMDDLWSYNTVTREWSEIPTGSTKPAPRYGHAATPLPDGSVILSGGNETNGASSRETWKLNPDKTYTLLGYAPIPLAFHVVQLVGDVLYVFGKPNVVAAYNITTSTWTETAGGPPLWGSGTSAVGENAQREKIVFFYGGLNEDHRASDVVYEYNTVKGTLAQRTERMPFPQIWGASAVMKPRSASPRPAGPSPSTTSSSDGLAALFFGGISNARYSNKTFMFMDASPPRFLSIQPHAAGGVLMRLQVVPGVQYRLDHSSNLATWQDWLSATSTTNQIEVHDTNAIGIQQRFYRAIQLP
jgi:hypothetical protein